MKSKKIEGKKSYVFSKRYQYKETKGIIKGSSLRAIDHAINTIIKERKILDSYVKKNPEFVPALTPLNPGPDAPRSARLMCSATKPFSIGPMAAVAGVLADIGLEAMEKKGAKFGLVENGGELCAFGDHDFVIGVYAGPSSSLSGKIGFLITEKDLPLGLGNSSWFGRGRIGKADACIVFAENAGVGDAAATAIGLQVKGNEEKTSIETALKYGERFPMIQGILIIRGDQIGTIGKIPKIVQTIPREVDAYLGI
ncbi:MAG: UPF0280 family protein [Candidatus Hodarchaeota archaeon]